MITFASVCSGIEAASVAWEPLGMRALWLSEIDVFPSAVLAHHWPNVANLGDMCRLPQYARDGLLPSPDILIGGTPCQSFSVAGDRLSLSDPRGELTLKYVELCNELQPKVIVWENVPGVLSTKDNAFGCFLGALVGAGCELHGSRGKWPNAGYVAGPERTVAWRVLDAQYFGVAQRRRRVFVVASPYGGIDPGEILFESEGVRRDTAPSRQAGQEVAGYSTSGFGGYRESTLSDPLRASSGRRGASGAEMLVFGGNNSSGTIDVATAVNASPSRCYDFESETFVVHGTQDPIVNDNLAVPLARNAGQENAVYGFQPRIGRNGRGDMGDLCNALSAQAGRTGRGDAPPCVTVADRVRRLLPLECERLQGFPDNFTQIPYKNKPANECKDGPRYTALGNSMAVPVIRWIGYRIVRMLTDRHTDR